MTSEAAYWIVGIAVGVIVLALLALGALHVMAKSFRLDDDGFGE